jgi:hypothetical protein
MEDSRSMSSQQSDREQAVTQVPPEIGQAPHLNAAPPAEPSLEPTPTSGLESHHDEFASFHEQYVRHYIQLADAKAGVCFGLISAVLGYLVSNDEVQTLILKPSCTAKFGITAIAMLLLLTAGAYAFAVIAPRLSSPSGEGLVFFGAVARRASGNDYVMDVASRSPAELTALRLKHCFDTSKVCDRKYGFLKVAIWLALPGLGLALATLLLL